MSWEGEPLAEFVGRAREWLAARVPPRPTSTLEWGSGDDSVAIFQSLSHEDERAEIEAILAWQRDKSDAGFGSISWPVEYGGRGLPKTHEDAFRRLEREFDVPANHEAVGISLNIESPTILALGSDEQRRRWLPALRRGDSLCCQLFSEPGAGSDLGALSTTAVRDGDGWRVNGQKVWTTGAQFADLGYLIARTDPTAERRAAFTAFVIDMRSPGIEVRPLRQMSGGTSFNEVFLDDVRVPDADRLGAVGGGWHAAMTTLGFERVAGAGSGNGSAAIFDRLVLVARHRGRDRDPLVRQALASIYCNSKARTWTNQRAAAAARRDGVPGPMGSVGKLAYSNGLTRLAEAAALIVGSAAVTDTGEWGTFAWSELILGAPGMRIAGGSDEIQRNTIAERVLGLPKEPR